MSQKEDSDKDVPVPKSNWNCASCSNSGVKSRLLTLLNSGHFADIHFRVGLEGNIRIFPAHKNIICAGSDVFATMFSGTLPETGKEVVVSDVEPDAFFVLLKFLYTDTIEINEENLIDVLYAAKKYLVLDLEKHCTLYLEKTLNISNVFKYLLTVTFFDLEQAIASCFNFIDNNAVAAFNSDGFNDLDIVTLCNILKRDTLRILEVDVFHSVMRWSVTECERRRLEVTVANKRSVLERALELIRFPIMPKDDFCKSIAPTRILSDEDEFLMLKYFNYEPKPKIKFCDKLRSPTIDKMLYAKRYNSLWNGENICGHREYSTSSLRFSADQVIYLIGCVLFPYFDLHVGYDTVISITEAVTRAQIAKDLTKTAVNRISNKTEVKFNQPIRIEQKKDYLVEIIINRLQGDAYYTYYTGEEPLSFDKVQTNSGVVTFQFVNTGKSSYVNDKEIPELIFIA